MCALIDVGLSVFLPEIFLSVSACVILMLGVFSKKACFKGMNVLVGCVIAAAIYLLYDKVPENEILAFDNLFKSNLFIIKFKMVVLCASLLYVVVYKGQKFLETSSLSNYEFPVLVLFAITGMLLMLSANNFLSFYISLELQSLSLYVIAAFEKNDNKASEAGLKYFVIGSFASGLLLFGISLIYGFTGNLDFDSLKTLVNSNSSNEVAIAITIGIILVLVGMFFKASAVPFHMWTPDVYQGSPTIVTTFFATIVKIASVGFLVNITSHVFAGWKVGLQPVLLLVTSLSLIIGAIGALKQENLKRLLAYSSIGHVGFMMLAISTFKLDNSVISYLIIYTSMTLPVFAIIMGIKNNGEFVQNIKDLSGLSRTNPILAFILAVFIFSLAGIPPFAGFFAKFYVFQSAIKDGLYITVTFAVVATVISAYYYLKIIKIMYLDETNGETKIDITVYTWAIISLLSLFNLCYVLL